MDRPDTAKTAPSESSLGSDRAPGRPRSDTSLVRKQRPPDPAPLLSGLVDVLSLDQILGCTPLITMSTQRHHCTKPDFDRGM